ncbi:MULTISPECIES: M50 family metallopeptidase [unclassified Saccharicrinis]|uniref:M50 family metallopeptidase n=1 Tax=unclassified Saccharicrinis TaxID=2646859 RepID=UPI003D34526F
MRYKLLLIILTAVVYWILQNYVPYGAYIILPINLFVTFLHEFGHAIFAIISGGDVQEVFIQTNGAGYAVTAGGFRPLILMGGYIGSALFGNLLLHIGLCKPKTSVIALYVIIAILVFTAVWWYSSPVTSFLLIMFSALAFWMSKKSKSSVANLLVILGTASIIYIIMDYNSGPSSDLARFTEIIPILPQAAWAIVWLIIVVWITWLTLKNAFRKSKLS